MTIITSLLDNDFYKFTMQQAMLHHYPQVTAESWLLCRGDDIDLRPFVEEIREEIQALSRLKCTEDELAWLSRQGIFQSDFIHYLSGFSLNTDLVNIFVNSRRPGGVSIEISGLWLDITLFEIFVLTIISEVYSRHTEQQADFLSLGKERLNEKIKCLKYELEEEVDPTEFQLIEFGTRRRFSRTWHREVISVLMRELGNILTGTSNMQLAYEMDIPVKGTMGHEWFQAHQALVSPLQLSQKAALEIWLQEYGEQLSIALTDTVGLNAFLNDFDEKIALAYKGVRHDSGDPVLWGEAILAYYQSLGIDTKGKTMVFSDSLDFKKALVIFRHFYQKTNVAFGIGTWLTNDTGMPPLRIVQKLVKCNGLPVAKISDTPGKTFCIDQSFLNKLRHVYDMRC